MTGLAKEVYATKLATGGIVAFASDKDKEKGSMVNEEGNPLLKKMLRREEQAAPVVNKTGMGIGAAPIVLEQAEPIATPIATPVAAPVAAPVQPAGIPIVQGPSVADKVLFEQKQEAAKEPELMDMQGILSSQKENVAAAEKEAAKGIEERVKERSDIKEKLLGKDTETAEYRKSIMDEKANAPDEARRQMGMRLMEFGANWASTPGAPLIAGMRALKDTLPSVMEDTKQNKKMMKDLDKSVYLLNHSERLDAEGRIDAAAKAREDASKLVMDHKQLLVTYGLKVAEVQEKSKQAELDRASAESIAAGNNAASIGAAKERYNGVDRTGVTGTAALQGKISLLKSYESNSMYARSPEGKAAIKQLRIDIATASNATPIAGSIFPVGTKKNGYIYKGGDPNSESSWEKEDMTEEED